MGTSHARWKWDERACRTGRPARMTPDACGSQTPCACAVFLILQRPSIRHAHHEGCIGTGGWYRRAHGRWVRGRSRVTRESPGFPPPPTCAASRAPCRDRTRPTRTCRTVTSRSCAPRPRPRPLPPCVYLAAGERATRAFERAPWRCFTPMRGAQRPAGCMRDVTNVSIDSRRTTRARGVASVQRPRAGLLNEGR